MFLSGPRPTRDSLDELASVARIAPRFGQVAEVVREGLSQASSGMGPSRLASETGMRAPEAKKFIESYFRALPAVKRYLDESLAQARQHKEVWTMFGRRRPLPDIDSTNMMQRVAAENMAVNTPIQGAAADIVKRAMLLVHDVPEQELTQVQRLVRDAMAGAAALSVPLEVSMGHGRTWLSAH